LIGGVKDQNVKQQLLMADERSLKEALNRTLKLQAKKTEAGQLAKMGEVRDGNSKRTWSPATKHHKTGRPLGQQC
jgi:hypothetical protein